jgi:hypothetical protein
MRSNNTPAVPCSAAPIAARRDQHDCLAIMRFSRCFPSIIFRVILWPHLRHHAAKSRARELQRTQTHQILAMEAL